MQAQHLQEHEDQAQGCQYLLQHVDIAAKNSVMIVREVE
jgi:hypothetical protein